MIHNFNTFKESPIHRYLFWVATSVLQLDEASLYACGLALLEQNLHTLDSQGTFDDKVDTYIASSLYIVLSSAFSGYLRDN